MANDSAGDLFAAHRQALEHYLISKTGCRETTSDLLQDTFLRFLRADRPKPIAETVSDPGAFLFRIAKNLLIDHRRKSVRQKTAAVDSDALDRCPSDLPSTERVVAAKRCLESIMAALDDLPPRMVMVFRLHRVHGYTYRQIARRLGISQTTVKNDLTAALHYLTERAYLDDG